MDLSSIWPNWGSQGNKPPDGKDYEKGDNVAAGSLDYLWYYIKDTFEKVETALSNKADDPHDNASHSENYITSGEVDSGAPDPHGNSSHDPNFLPSSDYTPVTTVEGETSALNIDITGDADTVDGKDASAFIESGEDLKVGTNEIYLEDPNLDTDGDGIDVFDVQAHYEDFKSPSGTYKDLLQTVYAFQSIDGNGPERDADGDIRLDAAVQSDIYTMTFGIRAPLEDGKIRVRGQPILMQNHAGNTVAKIDSNGNLEVAGTVTENVTV